MRLLGIALMGTAIAAAGFWAAGEVRERLDLLILIRQMMYHLKNRILYAHASLPEAVQEVGVRFSEEYCGIMREPGLFFLRVSECLETGQDMVFADVWKRELEQMSKKVPLCSVDVQNLSAVGGNLGYADLEMQERTILFYLEQTDDSISRLKAEVEGLGKLYRSLGIAAGIFVTVLLV